jgi:hypothetical protein
MESPQAAPTPPQLVCIDVNPNGFHRSVAAPSEDDPCAHPACQAVTLEGQGFSPLEVAGAMAKREGWRRSSLARLVSHLPSFPSAHDWAQRPCFGGMRAR